MPIDNTDPTQGQSIEQLNQRFQNNRETQPAGANDAFQKFVEKQKKAGVKPNYASAANRWGGYKFEMPIAPSDQGIIPEKAYGLGDWDYKLANSTDKLGPNGQGLPPGAVGWTAQGEAWYGTKFAFTEWAKGFANNVFKDSSRAYQEWINKRFTLSGDEYKDYMNSIGGKRPDNEQSALKTTGKAVWQVINGVLTLAQATAEGVERVIGAGEAIEALAETSDMPDMPLDASPELTQEDVENLPKWAQKPMLFASGLLDSFDLVELAWDGVRSASILFSNDQAKRESGWATLKDGWNAGKMAYSNWINPATKEEFIRRLNAGENEFLLRKELENPWAEMAGELILDPLNFIGVLTKAGKTSKVAKTTLTGVIAGVGDEVVQAASHLDDFKNADNLTDFAHAIINHRENLISDLGSLATNETIKSLTTSGRRSYMQNIVGQYVGNLASTIKNISSAKGVGQVEEMMHIMDNVIALAADNVDDVEKATAFLGGYVRKGVPYELLFSDGALQTAYVMREFQNVDDLAKLKKILSVEGNLADNVGDFIRAFDEQAGTAAKKLFPTLAERVAAGEKLTTFGQAMLRVEGFANSGPMRGINSFFAHVYMGMSPGYAARNLITNTLHIFVDEGFEVFKADGKIRLFGTQAISDDIVAKLGHLPGAAERGLGPVGEFKNKGIFSKITGVGLELGAKAERNSSLRVFNASLKRTFNSMLKPGLAVPDIAPLLDAGMTQEAATFLQKTLINTQGDVGKAMSVFRESMANGSMDLFRNMGWLDDNIIEGLRRYDIEDQFRQLMTRIAETEGSAMEDALSAKDEIIDALLNRADDVTREAGSYPPDGHHLETLHSFTEGAGDILGDDALDVLHKQMLSNMLADQSLKDVTVFLSEAARNAGLDLTTILENHPQGKYLHSILNNQFWPNAQALSRDEIKSALAWTKDIRAGGWKDGSALWNAMGLPGQAPAGATPQQVLNFFWDGYYRPKMRAYWRNVRESQYVLVEELYNTVVANFGDVVNPNAVGYLDNAIEKLNGDVARYLDSARHWDVGDTQNGVNIMFGADRINEFDEMRRVAAINGFGLNPADLDYYAGVIPHMDNVLRKHAPQEILDAIGKPLDEITHKDFNLQQVTEILSDYRGADFIDWNGLPESVDLATKDLFGSIMRDSDEVVKLATPENPDLPPSLGRGFWNGREELEWMRDRLGTLIKNNWGRRTEMTFADEAVEAALGAWEVEAVNRTTKMRTVATDIATKARDFALLDYGAKNNFDTLISMVYPYGFWYTGTYPNWMVRLAQNPGLLAGYAKYREALEDAHAGMPDWWKYNVNTNELFGLNSENPFFFNLEATLNPLNGLTGVDFEDRYKIVNNWTQFLNDLNRFGPSTHTIFNVATALSLWKQGEQDAAARWAGRLIPFTQTFNAISAATGFGVNETDPFVQLFSGGIDPYTKRRVQRSLAQMQLEGMITEEQAIDAARSQKGDIWDIAHERAVTERAPGQISSFLLGVGFKARNMADMATDVMYQDYFRILSMRDNLSPEEFRIQLDMLHEQYPMMNTILISDNSEYAYNVLGRIPPGQSREFYEISGISPEIVNLFYDSKGDMSPWSEGDRNRFLAAIVDLGAILAIPSDATRKEWTQARNEYSQLTAQLESMFNENIQDKIDTYYALYRTNKEFAHEYLDMNPDVSEAMDFRAGSIAMNPMSVLATYYGGIEQISNFFKGEMYDDAELEFGVEIFTTEANYWSFSTSGDRKTYLAQHPELKEYWDFKRVYQTQINDRVVALGSMISDPQGIEFREDVSGVGIGASQMIEEIQGNNASTQNITMQQWVSYVGDEVVDIAIDALRNSRQLSYRERELLTSAAEKMGLESYNELIQRIGISEAQNLNSFPVQNP